MEVDDEPSSVTSADNEDDINNLPASDDSQQATGRADVSFVRSICFIVLEERLYWRTPWAPRFSFWSREVFCSLLYMALAYLLAEHRCLKFSLSQLYRVMDTSTPVVGCLGGAAVRVSDYWPIAVVGSIPGPGVIRDVGQLSLPSLRGRYRKSSTSFHHLGLRRVRSLVSGCK